jgi:signal transduction histidine kinase
MTLRLRLFALLVALAALLAVGEWLLVRTLAVDLQDELASAAASVSQDVLRILRLGEPPLPAPGTPGAKAFERRVYVLEGHVDVDRREDAPVAKGGPEPGLVRKVTVPLPPGAEPAVSPVPPPGTAIERGVLQFQVRTDDGKLMTERHEIERRIEPGAKGRMVLLHGPTFSRRVPVPTSGVDHAIERFTRRLLLASLGLFAGALVIGVVVAHRFTSPLRDLAAAARQVGAGDLGVRAPAASGEVGEAIAAFNQMSQQLRALDAETQRLRASEHLSELGEVGRGLAHSLRNPLNALGLALDQLADRATSGGESERPDADAVASSARRQIRRIDAALRGFLALSAADAAAGEVDLVEVARDVALEALQTRAAGEPASRVEVVAAAGPVRLHGVEAELRAALQALVVNAIEASPSGAPVVVRVEPLAAGTGVRDSGGAPGTASTAASVRVTVDDEGPGLPQSVRERLFTPHVTTKAAGAGVGLYLAHRLATNRYGGDLAVGDREGGGTRAVLLLRGRGGTPEGRA